MRFNVDGHAVFATTGGAPFDPAKPEAYVNSFAVKRT